LLSGDRVLATRVDPMAKGQAEHLMGLLEAMLAGAGHGWRDLAALGVGTGPGNFTGIRIAVAAARGLALGLGIPAVGVNGFDAAAWGLPRPLTVRLPAPRGMAYAQRLTDAGAEAPQVIEDATAATPDPKAPDLIAPDLIAPDLIATDAAALVTAIARIAAARWRDPALPRPAPLYVRSADAAPSRDPAPVILP